MQKKNDCKMNLKGVGSDYFVRSKEQKGITLIALIITIIVMLILVAVTVKTAISGGLFSNAGKAVTSQELAQIKEAVNMWYTSNYIGSFANEKETHPVDGNVARGDIKDELTLLTVAEKQQVELTDNIHYEDLYYLSGEKLGLKLAKKMYFIDINTKTVFINGGAKLGKENIYVLDTINGSNNTKIASGSKIYASSNNTYVLHANGDLYSIGESNSYNPLGINFSEQYDIDNIPQRTDIKIIPENEANDDDFVDVQADLVNGYYVFRTKKGNIYATGKNSYGQLGVGDTVTRTELSKVNISNVKEIGVTATTVYYLKNDGTLWATGKNYCEYQGHYYYVIKNNGEEYYTNPVQITHQENGKEIFADIKDVFTDGQMGAIILKENGEVWATGGYDHGGSFGETAKKIHNEIRLTKIEELATKNSSYIKDIKFSLDTIVLLENGEIYASGNNWNGELANGLSGEKNGWNTARKEKFEKVNLSESIDSIYLNGTTVCAITESNNLYLWGKKYESGSTPITSATLYSSNVISSGDCGHFNTWYLKDNGEVYIYSYNSGDVLIIDKIKKGTTAGFIDNENYFWTFGSTLTKDKGKKLILTKTMFNDIQEFIYGSTPWEDKGYAVVNKDGKLYAWGANEQKIINNDSKKNFTDKTEITLPTGVTEVKKYKHNPWNAYILDQNNELWVKGHKSGSGISSATHPITEWQKVTGIDNIKEIYTNFYTVHIVKNDGTVWGIGANDYAKVGIGIIGGGTATYDFTQLNRDSAGNNIDFSNLKTITEGGIYHVAALMEDGTVYVWGKNDFGKLGTGDTTQSAYPTKLDSNIFPSKVVDVKTMYNNTVFLLENGDVYVTGDNTYGQLGIGNRTSSTVPVKANISNVKEIVTGLNHIIAIKKDDSVWAWGSGTYGQLGTRKSQDELTPVEAYELCK